MDDNELDKLFGYDGGSEGSDADDSEHLQIVKPDESGNDAGKGSGEEGKESKEEADGQPQEKKEDADDSEAVKEPEDKDPSDGEKADKPEGDTETEGEESAEEEKKKEEKPSEEQPKETKKKKKAKFRITGFGIAFIVLVVILLTAVMLFLFLPIFRVREVTVEGNIEMTDEEVLKEVGLEYNAHLMRGVSGNLLDIIRFNYGKTEERIRRENAYIADITISVRIPSEVHITVKERRKIAYVSTPDGYIALDRYGTVLELISGKNRTDVRPVVYGVSVESAKLGERVQVRDENSYKRSIIVLGSILSADNATIGDKFNMFENTTEVRVLPSGYIFLTIYTASGKPVQVKLNNTDKINEKMAQLLYLFNSNAFDQITIKGTLDMTGDEYVFNPSTR